MAQSLSKVYIHLVFSTKDRDPVLADLWRDELFNVLGGCANKLGCQSLIVGGIVDHVHMLFQLARTISLSDAVGTIKSNSSAWINQTRSLSTHFQWQGGCRIFRKSVKRRGGSRLYPQSIGTSYEAFISGRIAKEVAAI